jgi:two-component system chemotaxis sensor kinase CheA
VETLLLEPGQIQTVNQQEVIVLRGQTLPLLRLREEFAIEKIASESAEDENSEGLYVVVVGLAEKRLGLIVDGLVGEKEVVIKSLSRFCRDVPGVSGATILGDGNVALIADVNGLVLKETA